MPPTCIFARPQALLRRARLALINEVLDLAKIESTGFIPVDADEMLVNYVRLETRESHQTASH